MAFDIEKFKGLLEKAGMNSSDEELAEFADLVEQAEAVNTQLQEYAETVESKDLELSKLSESIADNEVKLQAAIELNNELKLEKARAWINRKVEVEQEEEEEQEKEEKEEKPKITLAI